MSNNAKLASHTLEPEDILIWRVTESLGAYQAACA